MDYVLEDGLSSPGRGLKGLGLGEGQQRAEQEGRAWKHVIIWGVVPGEWEPPFLLRSDNITLKFTPKDALVVLA